MSSVLGQGVKTGGSNVASLSGRIAIFSEAEQAAANNEPVRAVELFSKFLLEGSNDDAEVVKCKETAILRAGQLIKGAR